MNNEQLIIITKTFLIINSLIFNYLKISFAFFLLHAGFLVEVNHTSCTFALCGSHHFLHNLFYCVSFTFYRSCERPASKSTETYFFHLYFVLVLFRQTVVVRHNELSVEVDDRSFLCKVQWNNRNILKTYVLPYIKFGPVAQREHTDAFSFSDAGIINVPKLRTLVFRVPLVEFISEGEYTFFCT